MSTGKKIFDKLGAQFREVYGKREMLLDDVVYTVDEFAPCGIKLERVIGRKAVAQMRADPDLRIVDYMDEDIWSGPAIHLITALGMCLATCQLIEYYVANSFLLGISKQQKRKYKTIDDLRKGWKKKTFGNMLKSMQEAWEIEPALRVGLELFLANRNLLVHGITMDERFDIRTHWGREELVSFLTFFDIHARIVKRSFRSSYFASISFAMHQWGRPEGISPRMFGKRHEAEADLFFHFFTPKGDAI